MPISVKVKLVNFHNPNEIYIKFLEGEKSRNNDIESRKVNRIQGRLNWLSQKSQILNHVDIGEIYGCYISTWKKWIRGKVIKKQNNDGYTIFCIDHGHYKGNVKKFINILDDLKFEKTQTYYKVSLGLTPLSRNGEHDIYHEINQKKAFDVQFIPFFEDLNQFIGDLFIFEGDNLFNVSEKLISLGLAAKPTTDFNIIFNMLHDQEIEPLKTIQPKKRLEIISQIPQNELKLPNNLILHGNDLKPFWSSINDSGFQNFLIKKFSYKNDHLNEIQKVIWPQIMDGKHVFVICSNQDCLISIYILPLINKLFNRVKADRLGPSAIIFANNSSRIDEIVMQCNNYAKQCIFVVKAVGMCKNKIEEILNGCDILITTPSAFVRLIQSISYRIIDVDTVKHVVFDNFNQNSLNLFDKQLNTIIKYLYGPKKPQTIIVSKTYSSILKTKLLSHLPAAETVKCMDNYLDAAAFVGLSISLEISADLHDKTNKLGNTNFDSRNKNIIVVSQTETMSILKEKLASKAIKCDSPKIAEIWDESCPNNILIINDTILNDSIIRNADNLIHYDLPFNLCLAVTTSDQFSKRFKVFHNEIYKRLNSQEDEEKELAGLRTKIILSNENVSQFEELINLLIGRNLLKANENVIEKIYEKNEAVKSINKISICKNLLQFGYCMKFNCANRHKLSEQDKPPIHLEIYNNYISFDLISQQGPTTFVIKILEYYNNKWISCVQSNEYIQQKLDVDMQKYCNEKSNVLTLNEGVVGEIYAKYDNKLGKWIRGRMIKRKSLPIVELNLLDYVPDIPSSSQSLATKCHEKTLLKLSDEFTKLDPLLVKLQIMNLVPLDGEKSYNKNDDDELNDLMRKIPKDSKFYAKIEAAIGDVIFAKNIEAKNDNMTVIFQLTEAHSKLGISETDENIFKKIMELSSAFKKDPNENKQEESIIEDQNQSLEIEHSIKEPPVCWKQLKHNTSYPIIVKEFISPYSFFAVIINNENLTLENNLKAIEESQDHKQLISININECCLFNSNNRYLRAVILNILSDGQIQILLADYGEIQKCDKKNLFEITKEFLTIKFQSVHCCMLGLCPKYNMKFWPNLQRSAIHKLISKYNEKSLKMFVVKDDQKKHQFNGIGVNCYNVMLYDDESKSYLSKLAVNEGIASECVEYNDELYESPADDHDSDLLMDTSSSESDNQEIYMSKLFEMSESKSAVDFIDRNGSADFPVAMCNDSTEVMSSGSAESTFSVSIESLKSSKSMTTKLMSKKSTDSLKCMFQLPHIEWRQNDFMIYLLISANSCTEYALKINKTSLDVTIKYTDKKIERNIIQLYGSVKPKFCSHEQTGTNIIVRLAKKLYGLNWTRLTVSKEKSSFIKFSDDKVYWLLETEAIQSCDTIKPPMSDNEENDSESFKEFNINLPSNNDLLVPLK